MGKDSLAMWLHLRRLGFEITPYFLHFVPGLQYVEKSLSYYESFFGVKILRLPHPLFYHMVRTWSYQEPHAIPAVISFEMFPAYDFAIIDDIVANSAGLGDVKPYCAVGMRSGDNLERWRLIHQQGPVGIKHRRYYYAIWDWSNEQIAQILREEGCKLPPDYKLWGRTITAYSYKYLQFLKSAYPNDYALTLQWFPLLEADEFRFEAMKHHEPSKN